MVENARHHCTRHLSRVAFAGRLLPQHPSGSREAPIVAAADEGEPGENASATYQEVCRTSVSGAAERESERSGPSSCSRDSLRRARSGWQLRSS